MTQRSAPKHDDLSWLRRARRVARPWVYQARHRARKLSEMLRPAHPWNGQHHPVLAQFRPWAGEADGRFLYDALGAKIDPSFRAQFRPDPPGPVRKAFPSPSATYFELTFLLESIEESAAEPHAPFVMVELGAGYGPWLVNAHRALDEVAPGKPRRLVGVEMEPQHYLWMSKHFRDNGLDPDEHVLLHAAVSDCDGDALFVRDARPDEDYGLRLERREPDPATHERFARRLAASRGSREDLVIEAAPTAGSRLRVRCVSLRTILEGLEGPIDFMHVDIQGEEERALQSITPELLGRVRRLLVATHSRRIHRKVRSLLDRGGWSTVWDFGFGKREATPYGDVQFLDGLIAVRRPAP